MGFRISLASADVSNWHRRDEERVEPYVDALTEEVLLKEDGPPALGLVYHLAGAGV